MQRYQRSLLESTVQPGGSDYDPRRPFTGKFGTGAIEIWPASGTFTVPAGISSVRVRGWGKDGSTTSFGAHCSAQQHATGGDINYSGQTITKTSGGIPFGSANGGGAANLFGPGRASGGFFGESGVAGMTGRPGSAAGTAKNVFSTGGDVSPIAGIVAATAATGPDDMYNIDMIGTGSGGGGGSRSTIVTGTSPGANEELIMKGGSGCNGGGAGYQAKGGFPGGGDFNEHGGGFFLKVVTGLTPLSTVAVTVATGGLIIIEY